MGKAGGQARVDRPAFYALGPGRLRDLATLLHPPYTLWHLSYVALGAAVAPHLYAGRLAAALGGFFLGVGICAHALDELRGRPLGTAIPAGALWAMALLALAGAVALGIYGAVTVSWSILLFVAAGAFLVLAYNLELWGGAFHSDLWFAFGWGAFPALCGYWVNALELRVEAVGVALFALLLSLAQRRLSTPVRELRRHTRHLTGTQELDDGTVRSLDRATLAAPLDGALSLLAWAVVVLAVTLVALRLT